MKTGTKAQRHEGTKWGSGREARSEVTSCLFSSVTTSCLRAFVPLCLILIGCTYSNGGDQPQTLRDKQDQTLRDPINYKPDNENTQPYDISGGGINNYDSKAMKNDLHDIFDP
jgi:hypothetical protein